jgi:DNA-binding phage protein
MVDIDAIKRRFESLLPTVDERMRRLIAAAESLAIDYGGISIVSRATGVSRRAIARGIVELGNPPVPSCGAIRKPGGRTQEHSGTGRDAGEGFGAVDRAAEPR